MMNKNDCLISIITPCYNSESTIEITLNSILSQNYKNYEYIIIDGGSTDKTLHIIDSYNELFNGKLKIVSEPDNGIYYAMNKGIRLARGELIGIINSDDYYENDTLQMVANLFSPEKEQVIYGYCRIIKKKAFIGIIKNTIGDIANKMIPHPTCFVSRTAYIKYGNYDTKYRIAADYELINRLLEKGVTFTQIESVLANFRWGGISTNRKELSRLKLEDAYIQKKYHHISLSTFFDRMLEVWLLKEI